MAEISVPRTPTPKAVSHLASITSPDTIRDRDASNASKASYRSPFFKVAGHLTPPPSSQINKSATRATHTETAKTRERLLASPPATLKTGPSILSSTLFGEIPALDSIVNLTEQELRAFVAELLPALGEARMSAAHSKLQHSLLSIENSEAAKRAEVEHDMTRREVQVLQSGIHNHRGRSGCVSSPACPPRLPAQRHLDIALKQCRILQAENTIQDRRLQQAKKLIMQLDDKNAKLIEDVHLLRQRIKQNRDHLNSMRSSGAISVNGTPLVASDTPLNRTTPRTPGTVRSNHLASNHVESQDPFDALLFAGQVLNGETNSVPATPCGSRPKKLHANHVRGAHSLSSLPTTPIHSRPITAGPKTHTPVNRILPDPYASISAPRTLLTYDAADCQLDDRDSTISASDYEEQAYTDYDVPASQASQRATTLLRRSSGSKADKNRIPSPKAYKQGKLFGQVKKTGVERFEPVRKRGSDVNSYDEIVRSTKKARMSESTSDGVGLGIASVSGTRLPGPGL